MARSVISYTKDFWIKLYQMSANTREIDESLL